MKACLSRPLEETEPLSPIHPPFEERVVLAIDRALREAWRRLLQDPGDPAVLTGDSEPTITQRLRSRLNEIRTRGGAVGYDADTFERPHVGTEYYDHAGTKVRKPDIVFALAGKPRPGVTDDLYDAIFVECKLIDGKGKNVGAYCNNGIQRFVDGSYAWRMPHGMMVAYVRTGHQLPQALVDGFGVLGRGNPLNIIGTVTACTFSNAIPPVFVSEHGRTWTFAGGIAPGPIQLRHLWLAVTAL